MSTRRGTSLSILEILYAIVGMLYFVLAKFQGLLPTIRQDFNQQSRQILHWFHYEHTEK